MRFVLAILVVSAVVVVSNIVGTIKIISISIKTVHFIAIDHNGCRQTKQVGDQNPDSGP
jgi:hypothetical protein